DHDFGDETATVVARGHSGPICAGSAEHSQIARLHPFNVAAHGEGIAGLTDRPDDIGSDPLVRRPDRLEIVPRTVERRPREVVHRRIDDDKGIVYALLHAHYPGQQDARIAGDYSTGFEHQGYVPV